jgi:adenylosuccinate lyase
VGATAELMGTEVRHLQRTEVAEVQEPFGAGQKGSSAMPHKRNPIKAEQLSGLARVLRGYLGAGLEDVALWHERDISHSSVERIVLPDASILAHYLLVRSTALVRGLTVDAARMRENIDRSWGLMFSQPVLLALVASGMPRDAAYRLVQRNAMASWQEGKPFRAMLEADPDIPLTEAELDDAFSLDRALRNTGRIFDALDDVDA